MGTSDRGPDPPERDVFELTQLVRFYLFWVDTRVHK